MNKTEKLIVVALGLLLCAWLWKSVSDGRERAKAMAAAQAEGARAAEASSPVPNASAPVLATNSSAAVAAPAPAAPTAVSAAPRAPEKTVTLSNAQMSVTLTTRGGAVKGVTFFGYARNPGAVSAENPPVAFDFSGSPAFAIAGGAGLRADCDFAIESASAGSNAVTFASVDGVRRTIALDSDYRLRVRDSWTAAPGRDGTCSVTLGSLPMDASKNGLLSIDSMALGPKGRKVMHWGEEEPLKGHLASSSGGCSGSKDATGLPVEQTVGVTGAQEWIAVKNRFFVSALACATAPVTGFDAVVARDPNAREYRPARVAAVVKFSAKAGTDGAWTNESTFYLGPKKQGLLWNLGMKDVMEFGMWRWLCYPLVWVLNLFHSWIPNFGVGIILLTILVRLLFWPLTHKSTVSMRRMSEIQPKVKEIREKFKDNPQRLQQETWAVYRENKVNPMASCLPMLVQIPVFIALFTVLRSAVELRYAPFLWIADLSEPEGLFASWFPFGGLNVLPILMAVTMGLQSALTPSTGDKNQQRMMVVMMPVMMLVMFYSFPSALSLYWTLSQVVSIVQMWWIRKHATPVSSPVAGASSAAADAPVSRQMRRHGA